MRGLRRLTAALLCGLLSLGSFPVVARDLGDRTQEPDGNAVQQPEPVLSTDTEVLRGQILDFLEEMDLVLTRLAQYPAMQDTFQAYRSRTGIQVPLNDDVYDVIQNASAQELEGMREAMLKVPGLLSTPAVLATALQQLPPAGQASGAGEGVTASFSIGSCSDNYAEHQKILSRTPAANSLRVVAGTLAFAWIIFDAAAEIAGAATEDVPYVGKNPTIPLMIVAGVLELVVLGLRFAADEIDIEISHSELCLASCLTDIQPGYAGRGCDNRDNNCAGGIDELIEDRFPPSITVDASPLGVCFPDEASAQEAFELATSASDDCQEVTPSLSFTSIPGLCQLVGSATVSDGLNSAGPRSATLKVDGQPPVIVVPPIAACYPTLGAARAALGSSTVTDCPGSVIDTSVTAVTKECVADVQLDAVDECGNRSTAMATVRVDGTPPDVDIDELLVAEPGQKACFPTEAEAIRTVREATKYDDNCTPADQLDLAMTTSGTTCDLLVTSTVTAQDACGGVGTDSYLTRVDSTPPQIMCTVASEVLWPPDNRMVDVGLNIQALDDCDGTMPDVQIQVTSDEPTAFAFTTEAADDPSPDAVIERDGAGNFLRLLIRAQRAGMDQNDGRVYQITVTATDSCGFRNSSSCWVTVPHTNPDPSTALNSGQKYDATVAN